MRDIVYGPPLTALKICRMDLGPRHHPHRRLSSSGRNPQRLFILEPVGESAVAARPLTLTPAPANESEGGAGLMKRSHLSICFSCHVVALSGVRREWGAAGEAPPHPRPLSHGGARGEMSTDTQGPRRANLESGVFSRNMPIRASRTTRRRTSSPLSPRGRGVGGEGAHDCPFETAARSSQPCSLHHKSAHAQRPSWEPFSSTQVGLHRDAWLPTCNSAKYEESVDSNGYMPSPRRQCGMGGHPAGGANR
jgi:hypothetical protein